MSKWKTVKLGTIGDFKSGGTPTRGKPEYFEGNIPWITTISLGKTLIDENDAVEYISAEAVSNSSTKIISKNSIMVGIRVGVGKVSINTVPMCTSQDIISMENIDEQEIYKQYIVHCIKSFRHYFDTQKRGATIQGINNGVLKSLNIPVPPLEIQSKIAKALDTAAELLAIRKQQLAELDNLIKSTFYDMFGDSVTNEKGWEVSIVDKVCSKIMGGGTPSKSHSEYYIGNIPWVTPKDMKTIWLNDSIDHISEEAIEKSSAKLIPSNSVLMVIRSGILKKLLPVAINTVDIAINQDMKAFITNKKVIPEYLLYFFMLMQNNILKNVRAVTADNIEFGLIRNLIIPTPPLDLQTQFASIVTKIEEQKSLVKKAINETQYLFDSLMSEYFE